MTPTKDAFKRSAAKPTLSLICWNSELRKQRAVELSRAGFTVHALPREQMGSLVGFHRDLAPDAVVIDLNRLPSGGREVGRRLRASKSARHIPLVFAGGADEKVASIRAEMPDATYAAWNGIGPAIRRAIATPVVKPVVPLSYTERSGSSDLVRKLGLKPGVCTALIGDQYGIAEILGDLPDGLSLASRITPETRFALFVAASLPEIQNSFEHARARLNPAASFWMVHPKSNPRRRIDFNQNHVRELGLAAGFVDYKVASVNAEWSALKYTRPAKKRLAKDG